MAREIVLGIVGSRSFHKYKLLEKVVDNFMEINDCNVVGIVSGGAGGADTLAEMYARNRSIPIMVIKPDWKNLDVPGAVVKRIGNYRYNAKAGLDRNQKIVDESDVIIAFWDGKSKGTLDTINKASKVHKPVFYTMDGDIFVGLSTKGYEIAQRPSTLKGEE